MITRESIQKVIHHADIVEVIGHFISIKKRGANYIANCPFHNEKTPSFNINPAKGIFKCFGCGKGGDVVTFVEEHEKFSFVEAVRWLADYYKIELGETAPTEAYKQQVHIEESLRVINDFAADYFHDILLHHEEGQIIGGSYFVERGFNKNTIEKFKLGYSLESWDAFVQAASKNGFTAELLEKAGLIKVKEDKAFDNYRGRVIFPIFSNTGKVLGFGARILKKNEKAPKYVNTPENELYVKNKVLYGLYQSRKAINDRQECYLVEGYTDVISLHQNGVENVVASSGTSLTTGQLKLISHLTKNLTILYDGDAAGIKAALRGLDMALEENFIVKLVLLPEGEDPDSYIQKVGATAFDAYVAQHKRDVIEFMLEIGLKDAGNDPYKKSAIANEIAATIAKIDKTKNLALHQHYIKEAASKLELEEEAFIGIVNNFIREKLKQANIKQEREKQFEQEKNIAETQIQQEEQINENLFKKDNKEEWQLIKMLLEYGERDFEEEQSVAQYFFETVDIEIFDDALAHDIAMEYYTQWSQTKAYPTIQHFINHPYKSIKEKIVDLLQEKDELSENWSKMHNIEVPHGDEIYKEAVKSAFAYFKLKLIRKFLNENLEQLKTVTDEDEQQKLVKTNLLLKKQEKELMTIVIIR